MTLTFDLEGQSHILYRMVDFMGSHVKTKTEMLLS